MKIIRSAVLALSAVTIALAVSGSPANAEEYPAELASSSNARSLEPVSQWVLDYGENRCRLARVFGSEDDRHVLIFEQVAPRESFGLTLAGSEVGRFRNAREVEIGFQPDRPMQEKESPGHSDLPGYGRAIVLVNVSLAPDVTETTLNSAGINLEEAAKVDRIVLENRGRVLTFETENMRAPFEAMNACTGSLLSDWGLDPDQHEAYQPPIWTNRASVERRIRDQYPRSALIRREQAIFRMRVIVEEDGSVSECHNEKMTEADNLDSPACAEMMRARFAPARDADGNPMRSFFASSISYAMNR